MARIKRSWFEREEVAKITKDWVEMNCRITKREVELLKIINERKMVRRDMLEIISPSYRHLGNNRTRILNRSLNKMFKNMCIDKVHEKQSFMEGNTPAIISIDKAGAIILGVNYKTRIKKNKKKINGKEYVFRELPSNYKHINGINNLEVETIMFCENTGNHLSKWVIEKPQEFYFGQEKIVLIPDILMELKLNTEPINTLYAFIEFDTGSESIRYKEPPVIRDKIIKYKKYKLSNLWTSDYPYFPMILLVTEDEKRTVFFNKKCEENGLAGLGIYYKNYTEFLMRLKGLF